MLQNGHHCLEQVNGSVLTALAKKAAVMYNYSFVMLVQCAAGCHWPGVTLQNASNNEGGSLFFFCSIP